MELALYCPVYGYYEKEKDTVGRRGDFITSVSVGNLFGQLLAFQFGEWLREAGAAGPEARIVEAGAHAGQLGSDIMAWLRERRPELYNGLEYVIVEPSSRRREWQRHRLDGFGNKIRWVARLEELAGSGVQGIIFSNELLDALPVYRLAWDAKNRRWFEWGVALKDGGLAWAKIQPPTSGLRPPMLADGWLEILPDGFTFDICPGAEHWWREAAGILRCGKLVTIDYGLAAEEFFRPERKEGTLRAYARQHLSKDLLANPGNQDLTAHVNFTALQAAGESSGLRSEPLETQGKFLTRIAERIWKHETDFGAWTPAHTRQFQTLTHPEHLGRAFRVLIQSR